MDFNIVTFGDVKMFESALNAVAMLFNPSNTERFVSDDGIGLGLYFALGMTIALLVALTKGAMTLKFELGELIVIAIIYVVLFVPKFDVVLEDYYTGEVAGVDNVPLGIAFTGAFVSGLTADISDQIGVAYQIADPGMYTMKENGFIYPLKILNNMKNGYKALAKADPLLTESIKYFYQDCAYGRLNFDMAQYSRSSQSWKYLKEAGESVNGITIVFDQTAPTGVAASCQSAADLISARLDQAFVPGSYSAPTPKNPDGVSVFEAMLCGKGNTINQTRGGCPNNYDYERAFNSLVSASGTLARDFAMTSMTSMIVREAALCAPGSGGDVGLARCMPMVTALEQYKEDATAGGSMFQRTMLNSMSVMTFLFYAFAPLVSILMIVMGAKGLKLLGSYLMFGVWTQSWLPFATILHFYIQSKVSGELARFGDGRDIIAPAKQADFYDAVSTNLAIASDLLAATPIITLALLSGSIFALTGVANRLSARDYYNEKTAVPDMVSNGPVAMNTSAFSGPMGKLSMGQGYAKAPDMVLNNTHAISAGMETGYSLKASTAYQRSVMASLSELFSRGESDKSISSSARANGLNISESDVQNLRHLYGVATAKGAANEDGSNRSRNTGSETSASTAFTTTAAGNLSADAFKVAKLGGLLPFTKKASSVPGDDSDGDAGPVSARASVSGAITGATVNRDTDSTGSGSTRKSASTTTTTRNDGVNAEISKGDSVVSSDTLTLSKMRQLERALQQTVGATKNQSTARIHSEADEVYQRYFEQEQQTAALSRVSTVSHDQLGSRLAESPGAQMAARSLIDHVIKTIPEEYNKFMSLFYDTDARHTNYVGLEDGLAYQAWAALNAANANGMPEAREFISEHVAYMGTQGFSGGFAATGRAAIANFNPESTRQNLSNADSSVDSAFVAYEEYVNQQEHLALHVQGFDEAEMGRVKNYALGNLNANGLKSIGVVDAETPNFEVAQRAEQSAFYARELKTTPAAFAWMFGSLSPEDKEKMGGLLAEQSSLLTKQVTKSISPEETLRLEQVSNDLKPYARSAYSYADSKALGIALERGENSNMPPEKLSQLVAAARFYQAYSGSDAMVYGMDEKPKKFNDAYDDWHNNGSPTRQQSQVQANAARHQPPNINELNSK